MPDLPEEVRGTREVTLNELQSILQEIDEQVPVNAPSPEVMLRHPGAMGFTKAKVTMTYRTERVGGTTKYEQVPCILIEEEEDNG
jgi:hypothetical protein